MKIAIVIDSLGLPRKNINSERTWVEEFLKFSKDNVVYTFLEGGKYSADLIRHPINKLKPDLIIVQVAIVEAVRRESGKYLLRIVSRIPINSFLYRRIMRKYHLLITKLINIHYVDFKDFSHDIEHFVKINNYSKIIFC